MSVPVTVVPPTNNPLMQQLLDRAASGGSNPGMIVRQAISAPKLFHFGELWYFLRQTNVELQVDDGILLELFCFGTVRDYFVSNLGMELTVKQLFKLRQLSLVSLIHRSLCFTTACSSTSSANTMTDNAWNKTNTSTKSLSVNSCRSCKISYDTIAFELGLCQCHHDPSSSTCTCNGSYDHRVVEEIIISCIYDGLIRGKMNHHNQISNSKTDNYSKCLIARWATSRDVVVPHTSTRLMCNGSSSTTSLSEMIVQLTQFQNRTQYVLNHILREGCLQYCNNIRDNEAMEWNQVAEDIQNTSKKTNRTKYTHAPTNTMIKGSLPLDGFEFKNSNANIHSIAAEAAGFSQVKVQDEVTCASIGDDDASDRKNKRSRGGHTTNAAPLFKSPSV